MQWKYVAANNWGICADGNGAVGCGEQEEFRACSDIAIGKGSASAIPTIKPPITYTPNTEEWPTNNADVNHSDHNDSIEDVQKPGVSNFFGAIIALFSFFLVLCSFIAIYVCFYHRDLLKRLLRHQISPQNTHLQTDNLSSSSPPLRPPRIKKLALNEKCDASEA